MDDEKEEITPVDFMEAVYLNPNLPLNTRLRAAIEAAPYRHPKLAVTAHGHFEGKDFASQLERAIARSRGEAPALLNPPKVIEHEARPAPQLPAEKLKGPMPHYRNNHRRY
jgi:hypothetical protein